MGNKSEKTFADLFSSSITDVDTNTQSFSDILNGGTTEEKDETSTPLTFDSLFDKIPSTEIEAKQATAEPTELNTSDSNNNLFFNTESKEDNEIEQKESEITNFNPLFEITTDIKTTTNNESNDLSNNEALDETSPENVPSDNLFFQSSGTTENTENSKKEINKIDIFAQKDSEIDTITNNDSNDLNNNEKITKETNIENIPSDNLFFQSSDITENTENLKKEIKTENNIEIAPLFKDEAKIEENPFFEGASQNNEVRVLTPENDNEIIKENNIASETKEKVLQENLISKSTSPFFEEEKKSEENPFFQNQLSLIENQIPNTPSGNIDTTKTKHYNVKIVKKKESLIKFILSVLSYALFIFLLLIGIALLVYVLDIKIRAAKGDYSSPTFNAYVVLTGSMLPEIQVYDVVITKKVEAKSLKEGDVITFASADSRFLGTIITHRIIKKNPPSGTEGYTFQTRGDNNNVADNALVPANNIYGKVILKIPKLGYLQEFLASDGGWIIVILIPCLTVISYDIVKLMKGLKRKKYKNIKVQK